MPSFKKREELKNIIDKNFWQYYRLNKTVKPKTFNTCCKCLSTAKYIMATMISMMEETNYGLHIKNFAVLCPKDISSKKKEGLLRIKTEISNRYKLFFEDDNLNDYYRVVIYHKKRKVKHKLREPKPYAVLLHRKKIRKDNLNGKNKS